MILLGVSLSGLEFQPGLPIPGAETAQAVGSSSPTESTEMNSSSSWLLPGGLALGIVLLLSTLIAALLKKSSLKRIVTLAMALVILFILFNALPQWTPAQPGSARIDMPEAQLPEDVYNIAPIGNPPDSLIRWVLVGLFAAAATLAAWLFLHAFRQTQKADLLIHEVDAAVQAIGNGQNLNNVIVRCYLQMGRVIAEEQGIERPDAMTPREFETYLVGKGISRAPVLQLTRLFEKARYGNEMLDQQDEQAAVSCLLAIRSSDQRGG